MKRGDSHKKHAPGRGPRAALWPLFLLCSGALLAQAPGPGAGQNNPNPNAANQTNTEDKGVRVKDVARIVGVRSNQLLGYGLVVGLPGTGDTQSTLARDSIRNLLDDLGQKLPSVGRNARNIAAVVVTAELPPFARRGARINAIVSSIGDARSLEGGVLVQTPLLAGNRETYAVAQGVVTTGGGAANRAIRGTGKTVGIVLEGAQVEKEAAVEFAENGEIRVSLNRFDFATLDELQKAIGEGFKAEAIRTRIENGAIVITIPPKADRVAFIAKLEELRVKPKYRARVVINERSGTIVMGGDVRVDPVSVSRGGVNLTVTGRSEDPPKDRAGITEELDIRYGPKDSRSQKERPVTHEFKGTSVSEIVQALNAMGATVRDIIAILEALRDSGALHAELVVI